jgi:phosphoenolpyruvate synthase/pyruvate phosphate dikinase
MADLRQAKLYETQKSLTEWLEDIKHKDAAAIRQEDNEKRERLKVLKEITGLPFDQPAKFEATDLRDKKPNLLEYMQKHGDELCALRLIPKEPSLPKLRMRGKSVAEVYSWFLEQKIEAEKYRAEYIPHAEVSEWSTIFIVNKHGIQGEIIRGGHYQLTQGFFDYGKPTVFNFNFKDWNLSQDDAEAKNHLELIVSHLYISDPAKRKKIKAKLNGEFTHDYLEGYFETVSSKEFGLWFIDYSLTLGKLYSDMVIKAGATKMKAIVTGMAGSPGRTKGKVKIVNPEELDEDFEEGSVLVCAVTTPMYVPLMQKAGAIVTDQGGILSHAAIVARELKKPCIVGTGDATKKLKNGQLVTVNATDGIVTAN